MVGWWWIPLSLWLGAGLGLLAVSLAVCGSRRQPQVLPHRLCPDVRGDGNDRHDGADCWIP